MTRTAQPEDVFSIIAEPRRREIIALLSNGQEHTVSEIVLRMKMAQPAVSKHLRTLLRGNVVTVGEARAISHVSAGRGTPQTGL